MEFLVTMTTHVPEGTSEETVAEVRAREAENSARLAEQRRLLRLWRPPLGPGEWRSIGLFTAADADDLERTLAAMPLRIWRTDEVTALAPHPNDPWAGAQRERSGGSRSGESPSDESRGEVEFLTEFRVTPPQRTDEAAWETYQQADAQEAESAAALARQGHLIRLWKPEQAPTRPGPGVSLVLGLWRAADADVVASIVESLPLDPWMTVGVTPLTTHPSDPGHNTP